MCTHSGVDVSHWPGSSGPGTEPQKACFILKNMDETGNLAMLLGVIKDIKMLNLVKSVLR